MVPSEWIIRYRWCEENGIYPSTFYNWVNRLRILDASGNTVVEYSYDSWGVPTVMGDTELAKINPCSYRGYDYDEETGYYYLQSRYYDPTIANYFNLKSPWKELVQTSTSILLTVVGWFAGPMVYAAIRPVVIKAITSCKLVLSRGKEWATMTVRHFKYWR